MPGLGWAHDVYQAIAGENLVTGEKVEGFDRTMAVMGALSGGVFSKFNHIVKGSKVLRKIGKADNLVKNGDDYNDAVRKAGDWTKSGIDKDTTDSILKGAGDCLVDSSWSRPSNVIDSILGLIEDTAYASGKKPCEQVVDEVVESAKNSGIGSKIGTTLKTATEPHKAGSDLTKLGHAYQKHGSRNPDRWGKVTGSNTNKNEVGMKHFNDVLGGPGKFEKVTTPQGKTFLEKRLPDGRGIRLNQDGSFKGFLDPQ